MSKINSAESIRGLACLAVVFSHLVLTFAPLLHNNIQTDLQKMSNVESAIYHSPFNFWYSGSAAVFIFFVLSGYILSYAILSKSDIKKKLISMSLKRFPRLAIPALVSCVLAWIVTSFIDVNMSNISRWMATYGQDPFTFFDALYQGTIGAFIFGSVPLNGVLWTMQIELFGSFILFFLLYLYNINKKLFFIFSAILPIPTIIISSQFCFGIYSFIIGIYLFLYGNKLSKHLTIPALIIGLYFAGVHNFSHSYNFFIDILGSKSYTLLNIIAGPLIVFGVLMNTKISNALDKKPLIYLGKLSFSIYLLHLVIIYSIGIPTFNFLLTTNVSEFSNIILSSTLIIFLTLIFSHFYSEYIDALSIKVGNKIESFVFKK
ncbi:MULTISPECIES: acyltransferase [unclassified Acinetobacter]|uniref:acyltransferase family protein n=1 Tax=unclassified Acinetobacter TaxID=196816 RepID=UPI0015D13A89|nr:MULTISPECIES: acyltransferase [unclassified Acinetobacter]